MNMNVVSIVSVCIAFLSFIFTIIYNTSNLKKSREKENRDLIQAIKEESLQQGEYRYLFKEMNKNLERIVEDNKVMNERIYNLTERVAALEYSQQENVIINNKVPLIENKVDKAHQRIDIIEHDMKKINNG